MRAVFKQKVWSECHETESRIGERYACEALGSRARVHVFGAQFTFFLDLRENIEQKKLPTVLKSTK